MSVTSRNTKAEILRAYNALSKEYKTLEKDLKAAQSKSAAPSRAAAAPKPAGGKAGKFTISDIIAGLAGLRTSLGASTGDLQQKLTAEASTLAELHEAASRYTSELSALHGIEEPEEETLGELLARYNEVNESFGKELEEKKEAAQDELGALRLAWSKEKDEHRRAIKERDENLKRERKRDAENYKYDLQLRRNLEKEGHDEKKKERQKELDLLKETKEKEWSEREKSISEREKEYKDLKKKSDKFPNELETAVSKAKEEGTGIGKRNARIKKGSLEKDHEGKLRVYEFKISSLQETADRQVNRIEQLSAQLTAAQKKAQELAAQAIEGASNARSYEAVKEIALEQAKNVGKGK